MKKFNCPHCNAQISANQIPPDVGAAVGSAKSEAKARSSRENGKKSVSGRPVSRTKPVSPVPAAQVAEPAATPVGSDEPWYGEAGEPVTTLAGAKEVVSKSLAEVEKRVAELKPKAGRDYSSAYTA